MKSLHILLGFALLLVLVIGGLIVFAFQNFPQPTPLPQTKESVLDLTVLRNLEYTHSYCKVPMKLTDGVYKWSRSYPCNAEPSQGFLFQMYNDKAAVGDLSGDGMDDAAVVLTTNQGGSGNFRELAVVLNQNGVLKHVASVELGDRVIVNDISIQNALIVLDMLVHGTPYRACCPTEPVRKTFQFKVENQELVEL